MLELPTAAAARLRDEISKIIKLENLVRADLTLE
jgi:hypothetical protein